MLAAATGSVGNAVANGETRTLEIYHTHTRELATITYKRNGVFDPAGLEKLNWILRDWRREEPTRMDPRLFDIVWEVRREVGSQEPFHVVSAYRAPETNAMLRRRSKAVAKHSQHMAGKAMDFYLPDASMAKVREIALRLQRGGVGYYPTAYNPFVHLDAGSIRHWPRMTREQLVRLFPDGKTVHIPSDGRPLEHYEEALAEIQATGGVVSSYAEANEGGGGGFFSNRRGKSFFAALFGGGDEEEEEDVPRTRPGRAPARGQQVASAPPSGQQLAYAPTAYNGENQPGYYANTAIAPSRAVVRPAPEPRRSVVQADDDSEATPAPAPAAKPMVLARAEPTDKFEWSKGPASVARPGGPAQAVIFANVPLPEARPIDLLRPTLAPVGVAANVPLPPVRPVQLASAGPLTPGLLPAQLATETTASINRGLVANVPLPPVRPAELGGVKIAVAPPAAQPGKDSAGKSAASSRDPGLLAARAHAETAARFEKKAQAGPPVGRFTMQ